MGGQWFFAAAQRCYFLSFCGQVLLYMGVYKNAGSSGRCPAEGYARFYQGQMLHVRSGDEKKLMDCETLRQAGYGTSDILVF